MISPVTMPLVSSFPVISLPGARLGSAISAGTAIPSTSAPVLTLVATPMRIRRVRPTPMGACRGPVMIVLVVVLLLLVALLLLLLTFLVWLLLLVLLLLSLLVVVVLLLLLLMLIVVLLLLVLLPVVVEHTVCKSRAGRL